MRLSGLFFSLSLACLSLSARADQTLVLELPPSRPPQSASSSPPGPPASRAPSRESRSFQDYNRGRAASRGGVRRQTQERVVGRLGVTLQSVNIYAGPSTSRRVLVRIEQGTNLALTADRGEWFGVLMSDGSTGWVEKESVQVLNYEVVTQTDSPQYTPNPLLTGSQNALLQTAYSYLGVPYRYGGNSPSALDCSAFVQRCFGALGIRLPRTAQEQFGVGAPVPPEQLQAGDRLYFGNSSGRITHTGIYIGNGYFIHASSNMKGVAISHLGQPAYQKIYVGARR